MKSEEKQLLQLFRQLETPNKSTLLRFAEFLHQDTISPPKKIDDPKQIERGENETVVGALKRLSASYFMLDKAIMLNDTSTLMAQHIIQGRDKEEVIEELEILFKSRYEKIKREQKSE